MLKRALLMAGLVAVVSLGGCAGDGGSRVATRAGTQAGIKVQTVESPVANLPQPRLDIQDDVYLLRGSVIIQGPTTRPGHVDVSVYNENGQWVDAIFLTCKPAAVARYGAAEVQAGDVLSYELRWSPPSTPKTSRIELSYDPDGKHSIAIAHGDAAIGQVMPGGSGTLINNYNGPTVMPNTAFAPGFRPQYQPGLRTSGDAGGHR